MTNAIFLYVLAVAARRHHVQVHAFCVLSNHYHLVVTDTDARLPAFMQYLDSLVARATNSSLGRWEGFWSSETSYNAVSHGATDDIVRKIAYVLTNPVSAGLVRTGRDWPGLWTAPEHLGATTITAPRPNVFFSPNGDMPISVDLVLSMPPGFSSTKELQRLVATAVEDVEEKRRRERDSKCGFLGRARVLAQKPFARPASGEPRRQLNPRSAATDTPLRVAALARLKTFLEAYRSAWRARRSGDRDVLFPAGTYQLRIEHGVRCAAPA